MTKDDWVERTPHALQEFRLVHLFEEQYDLSPDFRPDDPLSWNQPRTARSVVCEVSQWQKTPAAFREPSLPWKGAAWGFAWAAVGSLLIPTVFTTRASWEVETRRFTGPLSGHSNAQKWRCG